VVVTQDDLAREHTKAGDDVTTARRRAASFGPRPDDPTWDDSLRAFLRRYGWRAYALPVLVVLTIAALLTARTGKPAQVNTASGRHPGATAAAPPVASSSISLKSDTPGPNASETVLKSAALPAGGVYTLQGTGAFTILKGTSKVVGSGPLHRYSIEVENGITGVDLKQFASLVQTTLSDPRSWSGHGVSLQRVDSGPVDFHVSLTSVMTERQLCGYDVPIETSCYAATNFTTGATTNRVVLNVARWVRGDANYIGDLTAYRQYMINHEDGHALGHQHAHDCLANGLAPTMMQQTIGLRSAVSGKLCAANPWPYPAGGSDAPGAEAPDTPQNSEIYLKNDG
jgi:Protein of unknown function (DUF3152)